jgi:hypothetical protein
MKHSEALDKLAPALAKAQSEMGGAVKEADNPFFKSKYADLTSVWKACKEALHDNGFSVVQSPVSHEGRIGVSTMLLHSSGQFVTDEFTLGVKKANDPQADGSSITYARRYALAAFVGVCPVDDDGEGAMNRDKNKETKKASQSVIDQNIIMVKEIAEETDYKQFQAWWPENGDKLKKELGTAGAKAVHTEYLKILKGKGMQGNE